MSEEENNKENSESGEGDTRSPAVFTDMTPTGAEAKASSLKFTKSFVFEYETNDGTKYKGHFTMKRLNLGDYSRIGVFKARYNSGEVCDTQTLWLHEMIAFLEVALTDMDDWWKPVEFFDGSILDEMYAHVRAYQHTFRK